MCNDEKVQSAPLCGQKDEKSFFVEFYNLCDDMHAMVVGFWKRKKNQPVKLCSRKGIFY